MSWKPSPAMVVALVALFVALTGNAIGKGSRLPANSVGPRELKSDAVTPPDIASNAVKPQALSAGAVTSPKLAQEAVTGSKIAPDAVGSAAIAPAAVETPALANSAVSEAKIADNSIATGKLKDNAIDTGKIKDNAITAPLIAPAAVTQPKILNGAIDSLKIANSAVGTSQLSNAIPSASANNLSDVTWTNGGYTALSFPTETFDTANLHNPGALYRMKAPVAGIYQVTVVATWQNDGCLGTRSLEFDGRRADDSTPFLPSPFISSTIPANSATTSTQSLTGMVQLAAGESVEIWGGATMPTCPTTKTLGTPGSSLTMSWMAPGP